ncbi:unnamed protein product [Gulo gulo]|uniref:Small ribosomal subunit protein uS10 domain-containing protein n=1 Tax=Gulo gulo TaxID=48420 RepID=A0A9X9MAN8_GULGU|nr:unnamed protein product [Gulo gulo]
MAFKDTRKTPEVVIHRIRITLTSHDLKSLEKVWADLPSGAQRKGISKEKRPVWMPTKTLRITQEKLPWQGPKTGDYFMSVPTSESLIAPCF